MNSELTFLSCYFLIYVITFFFNYIIFSVFLFSSHWFLAIICFPGLTGPVKFSDNTPVEPEEVVPKKNCATLQIGNTTITHIIKPDGNISLEMDCGSDRDEAEGDQDDLQPSSDDVSTVFSDSMWLQRLSENFISF